jgi:hypothetical protein
MLVHLVLPALRAQRELVDVWRMGLCDCCEGWLFDSRKFNASLEGSAAEPVGSPA